MTSHYQLFTVWDFDSSLSICWSQGRRFPDVTPSQTLCCQSCTTFWKSTSGHFFSFTTDAGQAGSTQQHSGSQSILLCSLHTCMQFLGLNISQAIAGTFDDMLQTWAVNKGVLAQRSIADAVAAKSQMVGQFQRYILPYCCLENIQVQLNQPMKRFQQDMQTCWNCTYYTLQYFIKLKRAILAILWSEQELPENLPAHH